MTVLDEAGGPASGEARAWAPAVVKVDGHVDVYNANDLRESLLAALGANAPGVVLDLTDLRFLDSSGIGILVGACRRAQATGKSLEVVGLSPQVGRVLSMSGVDHLLAGVAPRS